MTQVDTTTVKYATLASGPPADVEQGDSDGVPVVLLHGGSTRCARGSPCSRTPSSIRAFAVTQRGHGDADRPASRLEPERSPACRPVAFVENRVE